jgi:hypothetical protein
VIHRQKQTFELNATTRVTLTTGYGEESPYIWIGIYFDIAGRELGFPARILRASSASMRHQIRDIVDFMHFRLGELGVGHVLG